MEKGVMLRGKIIGFEEENEYVLGSIFGEESPLKLLSSTLSGLSFIVVNPYAIFEEYSIDVDDLVLKELCIEKHMEEIAILCIVRHEKDTLYANLRCPLIINTSKGIFRQVILEDEGYSMSFPFAKKEG